MPISKLVTLCEKAYVAFVTRQDAETILKSNETAARDLPMLETIRNRADAEFEASARALYAEDRRLGESSPLGAAFDAVRREAR